MKSDLANKFKTADLDANHYLSYDEFYKLTCDTNLKLRIPPPEHASLKPIFAEQDKNNDGKLTMEEFIEGMMNQLKRCAEEERNRK